MISALFLWNRGAMQNDLCKTVFLADLLEIQYFFDIYHTSLAIKMYKKC